MSHCRLTSINSNQFKAYIERDRDPPAKRRKIEESREESLEQEQYRVGRQQFDKQRTAVADMAAAKEKKFDSLLLAIGAGSVPPDYVHEPVDLALVSIDQIEKQCAIPPLVKHACAIWQKEANKLEPVGSTNNAKVSITHRLCQAFPFDEDKLVRSLANGDPAAERYWTNRFAAARLLGTRMHCYIELHARGIAIPEPLIDGAFRQFLCFWRDCVESNGLVPWRVEHTVHGEHCYGTVDALFARQSDLQQASVDEPLHVYLFDWKRCSHSLISPSSSSSSPHDQAKQQRHALQLDLQRAAIHDHHQGMVQVVGMFLCRFYSTAAKDESYKYELVQVN